MSAEPDPPESQHHDARAREHLLGPLRVVGEARRVLSDSQNAPVPERIAQGWERRFIVDEARAAEMVELYRELGYEAVGDAIRPADVVEDCGDCRLVAQTRLKMIYTRRGPASRGA